MLVYTPEDKIAGGLRIAVYFNLVPTSIKCAATHLHSVCLHGAVLEGLRVRNGILRTVGIQHDTMDRTDR